MLCITKKCVTLATEKLFVLVLNKNKQTKYIHL